jgi:hypothetical protein
MAMILDLNNFALPTMELTFAGAERTTLHVTAPTEALIDEMKSWSKTDLGKLSKGDQESVNLSYDLTARLLSCNLEGVTLTADDLRAKIAETDVCKKHHVDPLWVLIQIVKTYMEFIREIENEKN